MGIEQANFKRSEDAKMREQAKKWIDEIIKPLKPGDISPNIIDQDEGWLVVKYLNTVNGSPETYTLQAVVFPKIDYGTWIESEKQLVEIEKISR